MRAGAASGVAHRQVERPPSRRGSPLRSALHTAPLFAGHRNAARDFLSQPWREPQPWGRWRLGSGTAGQSGSLVALPGRTLPPSASPPLFPLPLLWVQSLPPLFPAHGTDSSGPTIAEFSAKKGKKLKSSFQIPGRKLNPDWVRFHSCPARPGLMEPGPCSCNTISGTMLDSGGQGGR